MTCAQQCVASLLTWDSTHRPDASPGSPRGAFSFRALSESTVDTDDHDAIGRIEAEVHEIRQSQQQQAERLASHDEAIRGLESGHARLLSKMDALRSETALWTADLRTLVIDRFDRLSERLDRVVLRQGEDVGRDEANAQSRSLWVTAAVIAVTAALAVAGWLLRGHAA